MSGAEAIITSKYANDKKKEEMLTILSIVALPIQTTISSLQSIQYFNFSVALENFKNLHIFTELDNTTNQENMKYWLGWTFFDKSYQEKITSNQLQEGPQL